MLRVVCSDIKYPLCFISALVIRLVTVLFSVFMILWLSSFIQSGHFANQTQVLQTYRKIIVMSMILTGVLLPIIGHLADSTPSRIIIPLAFLTRCIAAFLFVTIQVPDTFLSYLSCSILILATTIESISVEVLFMREMPGEVRGAMNGCLHFFGQIGILIFT